MPEYNTQTFEGQPTQSDSVATIEATDDDETITPGRVKAKLVTSLKQALLQNVKAMMGNSEEKDATEIEEDGTPIDTADLKVATAKGDDDSETLKEEATTLKEEEVEDDDKEITETKKPKKLVAQADSANDDGSESDAVDQSKPDLLEDNLMKIDKKKLVHLLANLMRKNRDRDATADTESAADNETVTPIKGKVK